MSKEDKVASVKSFLLSVKYIMQGSSESNTQWVLVTANQKNVNTIARLGITLEDVQNEILGLSANDFCEGPVKDKHEEGELWVFGKTIRGIEIYIKLKIFGGESKQCVRVVSFHVAEVPLKYCFK